MSHFKLEEFGDLQREQYLELSRIAEAAERFEDMCKLMKTLVDKFVKPEQDLSIDERNVLSVAYKNIIGARRASWRSITAEEGGSLVTPYKNQVEKELTEICQEVLDLLTNKLLPAAGTKDDAQGSETRVFYLKMAADYFRYLAEIKGEGSEEHENKAADFYKQAFEIAEKSLAPTHPIRLGLALNYSVCSYEILKKPDDACKLAKDAFDQAIKELDMLNESQYKDSTLIMQLLRDNLTLWTQDEKEEAPKE